MVNKYFSYKNIELWNGDLWTDHISKTFPLVSWMGEMDTSLPKVFPREQDAPVDECKKLPYYFPKTNSVDLPDIVEYWKERGVHYECRSQSVVGWILMAPTKCMEDFSKKIPSLVVMLNNDISEDPYWAMNTLAAYQKYNEMVAEEQNIAVIYISTPGPDRFRIHLNIMQEAYVFIPGDMKKVYLDVSKIYESGKQIKDAPDFVYWGDDPDADVIKIGQAQIPGLDISGKWENRTSLSRDQMMGDNWSNTNYCRDQLIYSQSGAMIAEGLRYEYDYDDTYDERLIQQLADMGLKYENREKNYRRWKMVSPLCAFDHPEKKLPVICVMQEVNSANDHLAVNEISYFFEYFRIAAQGECLLVNFVLEDNDSNDLLADIVEDVLAEYPADPSRIYIAGHSHNGFYSLEFAIRHPKMIAAVATFGDPAGFVKVGNLPMVGDRLAALKAIDMPIINLIGYTEQSCHFPLHSCPTAYRPGQGKVGTAHAYSVEERVTSWQLRLEACSCPVRTAEEIIATKDDPNYAVRMLGTPTDKAETIWMNGNEIYIADIKNNAGKYHLRIVGEENMPHNTTPNQQIVSWSWLRRFARNTETGESIELY